jgi:competence protein ComEC
VAGALVLVALLVVVLARYRRSRQAPRPVVVAAFFMAAAVALCLGAAGLHSIVRDAGSIRALAQRGAAVRVEATVVSDPRTLAAATQRSGRDLVLVELDVAAVEGRGRRSLASSRVLVFRQREWSRLHWGERIRASGRLAPSPPGDDVVATLSARGPPSCRTGVRLPPPS